MKKGVFYIILFLSSITHAQSVDFGLGLAPHGYGISANYNYYFRSEYAYLQAGLNLATESTEYRDYTIPYNDLSLHVGYFYPMYENNKQTFQIAAGGGLLAGYEVVNNNESEYLPDRSFIKSKSNIIYGAFLSGEVNIFLSRNIFFLTKYNQYYHLNSDLGPLTMYLGVGIRYYYR